MKLNEIKPAKGHASKPWRKGRGPGSGNGKTGGRGHKGQRSRRGHSMHAGFEGGQMPLHRRLPKRGFTNIFREEYSLVNTGRLDSVFEAGDRVTPDVLRERKVLSKQARRVKVLASGELGKALTVVAHKVSKAAQQKIEAAGGTVELLG